MNIAAYPENVYCAQTLSQLTLKAARLILSQLTTFRVTLQESGNVTVCSFKENSSVMTSSLQSLSFDGDFDQSTVSFVSPRSVPSNEVSVFRSRDPY